METAVLNNDQDPYNFDIKKPIFQVFSQQPKLPVSRIEYNDLKLEFFKPYPLTIKIEDGYLVHENMKMNMIAFGKTMDELVEKFFDYFTFLWRDYASAPDSELAPCAIKMKKYILSLAKEV